MSEDLLVRRDGAVVEITFNRPERHNAFTKAMYAGIWETCQGLAEDPTAKVLVLRGAGGRAFAAGNEISDFVDADAVAYETWIHGMLRALYTLPQVTIAAIDGVCVGGGLAVATHCDVRVATPHSRFGYPIAKTLGNALSAPIVYRCRAVFGESITRRMLLTAELVGAEQAQSVGALSAVASDLDAELESLVSRIVDLSPVTVRTTKRQLADRSERIDTAPAFDEQVLREVYSGPDFHEGVRAFLAKEKPTFRG
ncbi:enoyl-CoA hydratase-related protein [Nocardioides daejeonensis]|uniref:enoyl-CoA hydratase-related protein n=1 Tax=Nocardioides daejeonensis TaxID=1046556 RepID=UPI000D749899|nr:enoyl-CoA hydratase-related protein [Nocardioides daejeonensis]